MKNSLFLFATLLLFVSCVDEFSSGVKLSSNALVFDASQMKVADGTETKAGPISGTSFPTDLSMCLTSYSSTTGTTFFNDIPFSYNNDAGGWKATNGKYWPQTGTLDFIAYSCPGLTPTVTYATPNATTGITSFVTGDNRTVQADLMFGGAENCSYSPSSKPTFSFKHALSLVTFTAACPDVVYDSSTNTGVTIESITLATANYGGTCAVSRSGNTISGISWTSLANSYNGNPVPGISSQGLTMSQSAVGNGVLLPPQNAVNFTINYTVHSGPGNNTSKSYTYSNSGSWTASNRYVYAIEISIGYEVVVSAQVTDWTIPVNDYFYAENNRIVHQGNAFSLSNGQPVYWRRTSSDPYELLTYESGTWGSSVRFETPTYWVTVSYSGGAYAVSHELKRSIIGIDFRFVSVCHQDGSYNGQKVWYTPTDQGTYDEVTVSGFWSRSTPLIYDYVTSFDCIYDDDTIETIDLTQAVNYNNSDITCSVGGTLNSGNFYRNSSGFYSYASVQRSYSYLSQGVTYLDRTFTISYTVEGQTFSATRTVRHQGTFILAFCNEPYYTSAGQTVEVHPYGYCSLSTYDEYDLFGFVTSVSTTATDLFQISGNSFVVKSGVSNTTSGPATVTLTASNGTIQTANSTIWGSEATKWIDLRVDDDYWRMDDYSNYYDNPYLKKYYRFNEGWGVNLMRTFDEICCQGGPETTTMIFVVFKCKGDGSIVNISDDPGLSWSYNSFHARLYGYDENTDDSGLVFLEIRPDSYDWSWPWPPRSSTSFTSQPILLSGVSVVDMGWPSDYESYGEYFTQAWYDWENYGSPIFEDALHVSNFVTVTYNGFSSSIDLYYWD